MKNRFQHISCLTFILHFLFLTVTQGQYNIQGKVLDKITREPLELAVVMDAITGNNTLSDNRGFFNLKTGAPTPSLIISYIGYVPGHFKVGNKQTDQLTIELEKGPTDLKQVTISNHSNSIGHSKTLSHIDLNMKPARSAQDLLRLVPGLFIAQQVGGGKAEQIFLRGFDADHGTDVNITVDDMPVNLVSHAHGQGWADLHFVIPETVGGYEFGKGPYYANKGDFATAGYVNYKTLSALSSNMVKIEAGQYNTGRIVAMVNLLNKKAKEKGQSAYVAGEALYTNGPFDFAQHLQRFNFFGKFNSNIGKNNILTAQASTFSSIWRASGEIPNRAISEGYIPDRFGIIDSGQGGNTGRTNINIKLISSAGNKFKIENQIFYSHYQFNLFTNFTFFLVDPLHGDEFNQHEIRDLFGYIGTIKAQQFCKHAVLTSVGGLGIRHDQTYPSWLAHSMNYQVLNFLQLGRIRESNVNGYIDENLESGKWQINGGLRLDYFNFYYQNSALLSDTAAKLYNGLKTGQNKFILSPKLNIQYTFNNKVQVYLNTGKGFHSNDARVVIANQGHQILPAAYGSDLGLNWKPLPALLINSAFWYMFLQQEFTYGSDYGDESVRPGGKTTRLGIDFSARYQISNWLYTDLNLDFARPRALNAPKGQAYLPTAPTFTSTAGLFVRFTNGMNGGISYRYLHDRPANDDYSLKALGYFLTDLTMNYTKQKYELGISVENLFNQKWSESQIAYLSRLKFETAPVYEVSYTAGVPFFAKLKFSIFF